MSSLASALAVVSLVHLAAAADLAPAEPDAPADAIEKVSFADAVQRALARNTSALVAAQEIRRAEGLLAEARSSALPLLTATGTLTRLDADRLQPGTKIVLLPKDQQAANATLQVPLVAPARWALWIHGGQSVDVATASEADVRRTVALTAARAYLGVFAQKRALDVSRRARDTAQAHFEFSHARHQAGVGNAVDEARAQQLLATSEALLQNVYSALVSAQEALGITLGADRPIDTIEDPAFSEPPDAAAAQSEAESKRQDLAAARSRADAAERVWKDSWTDWLPTLLANAQPFYQHPPTSTTPQTGWQATLVLSLPIFEGGLRMGQLKERRALSDEALLQVNALLRQAHSDVRLGYESVKRADAALASSRKAAVQAEQVLDLTMRAYKAGATNSLDVTDAERQARDAETAAVQAEDALRQARLNLLAATGYFP
jgi:outer membrane protein TolC